MIAAHERMELNAGTRVDLDAPLNLHEWADETTIANRATVEIDRLHDANILTEFNIDDTCLVESNATHGPLPRHRNRADSSASATIPSALYVRYGRPIPSLSNS